LERLEIEHDNLRSALACFTGQEATIEKAARIALAVTKFWNIRTFFYEQRIWLAGLARHPALSMETRALLLEQSAGVLLVLGDYAGARQMFADSLEIMRELNDPRGISGALNGLAWLTSEPDLTGLQYDLVAAKALAEESLAIMREQGDRDGTAQALFRLGCILRQMEDRDAARTCWLECHELDRELGVIGGLVLQYLGELVLANGDYAEARYYFETFLAERYEIGERWGVVWGLQGLCGLALAEGELERAAQLLGAYPAICESFARLTAEDRAKCEALASSLREDLSSETFERCCKQGAAMTIPEAVAFALNRPIIASR
jgi:tetratricopeptide (TPR) repeat protein